MRRRGISPVSRCGRGPGDTGRLRASAPRPGRVCEGRRTLRFACSNRDRRRRAAGHSNGMRTSRRNEIQPRAPARGSPLSSRARPVSRWRRSSRRERRQPVEPTSRRAPAPALRAPTICCAKQYCSPQVARMCGVGWRSCRTSPVATCECRSVGGLPGPGCRDSGPRGHGGPEGIRRAPGICHAPAPCAPPGVNGAKGAACGKSARGRNRVSPGLPSAGPRTGLARNAAGLGRLAAQETVFDERKRNAREC